MLLLLRCGALQARLQRLDFAVQRSVLSHRLRRDLSGHRDHVCGHGVQRSR
jgi:hypothetical protein